MLLPVMAFWAKARTGIFALVFIALVFGVAIFQVRSPDLYWHIKMGSDWIFKGLSPFVDHYSYTMPGKPIVFVPVGFQVVIALLYRAFGLAGVGIYRFVVFSLALFFLDRTMRRSGVSGSLRILALATCIVSFVLFSEPRPELASLAFEALFVGLFLKWRDNRSPRQLVLPFLLLVVWMNVHTTGVIGVVIAFAFFAEAGLDELLQGRIGRAFVPAGYAALFFAASFLHHELSSPIPLLLHFDSRWTTYIKEFEANDVTRYEVPLRVYWALMALSLPALVVRRYWAGILLVLIAGYQGISLYKFTPHMLMLTMPFVVIGLQYYRNEIGEKGNARARTLFAGAIAVAAAAAILIDAQFVYARPILPLNMGTDDRFFPAGLVKHMRDTGVRGRVFNHYDWGAYLFFNFDQDIKVAIDQRANILYDIDTFLGWRRMATDPEEMKKAAEKYQFNYVVSRPDQSIVSQAAIESGVFGLEYVDSVGALFVRGRGRFPETQRYLYSPRCLDDDAIRRAAAEYAVAKATLPADSILTQYLLLLNMYASTNDKAGLFHTLYWTSSSTVARLASELAYRSGEREASLAYLDTMEFRGADDSIMSAKVLLELQRFDTAEAFLKAPASAPGLRDDQKVRIAELLRAIRDRRQLAIDPAATVHCEFLAKLY